MTHQTQCQSGNVGIITIADGTVIGHWYTDFLPPPATPEASLSEIEAMLEEARWHAHMGSDDVRSPDADKIAHTECAAAITAAATRLLAQHRKDNE